MGALDIAKLAGGAIGAVVLGGAILWSVHQVQDAALYKDRYNACKATIESIQKGAAARDDAGSNSPRDKRLRDKYTRPPGR